MVLPFRASRQTVIRPSTSSPPPPLFIPYGGFSLSTARSQPCPPAPFRNLSGLRLTQDLPFARFWPFLIQASGCSSFTWLPRRSISTKPNRCNAASTCRPVSRGSFTPTPRPRAARRPRLGRGLVPDTTRWPRAGSGAPRRGSCPDSNNCARRTMRHEIAVFTALDNNLDVHARTVPDSRRAVNASGIGFFGTGHNVAVKNDFHALTRRRTRCTAAATAVSSLL